MSRIYFPLKTSVELFDDRETPEAVTRVKQAAALYDVVVLEDGLYTAQLSTHGSSAFWQPWAHVDPQKLAFTRRKGRPGTPVAVGFQTQPGLGRPAEGPVRMFSQGELLIDYAAEFHTGIIDELESLNPDWLTVIAPGHTDAGWPQEIRAAKKALDQEVFFDRTLMTERDSFERSFIAKSFNNDAAVASYLEATFNVTSLFEPMFGRANTAPDYAGLVALELLVPNIASLPWEGILEFREHPGCDEARDHLREMEERVAGGDPEDLRQFRDRVQLEINDLFFAALDDLRPRWDQASAKEAAKTAIGFIPGVGPILAGVATAGEIVAAQLDYRTSWHAALLKLKSASEA